MSPRGIPTALHKHSHSLPSIPYTMRMLAPPPPHTHTYTQTIPHCTIRSSIKQWRRGPPATPHTHPYTSVLPPTHPSCRRPHQHAMAAMRTSLLLTCVSWEERHFERQERRCLGGCCGLMCACGCWVGDRDSIVLDLEPTLLPPPHTHMHRHRHTQVETVRARQET